MPEEHVVHDGQVGGERKVLVDGIDAECLGVPHAVEGHGFVVDHDLAGVGSVDPQERFEQGRFSRAVVADESDDLSRCDRDRRVSQRLDVSELLSDLATADDCAGHERPFCAGAGRVV